MKNTRMEGRVIRMFSVVGLCAGIGGIERGLARAGHRVRVFCEIDEAARAVLAARFPGVPLWRDVMSVRRLPRAGLVAAGFPCKDFSQAGATRGVRGQYFSLVDRIIDLIVSSRPEWVLLENVPFILHLHRGQALRHVLARLSDAGYVWAYRVVDAMAFGLPQRRPRVFVVASRTGDPREVLLADDAGAPPRRCPEEAAACGFYWTEGREGIGLAVDAVPPVKCSSSLDVPAPPALWIPGRGVFVPDVRDGERLQGFPAGWTAPAAGTTNGKATSLGVRWRLIGNAVPVPVSEWIGKRLTRPRPFQAHLQRRLGEHERLPPAAWGWRTQVFAVNVSSWPVRRSTPPILEFLRFPLVPLSQRACAGFLSRARQSTLRFPVGFLEDVERQALGQTTGPD